MGKQKLTSDIRGKALLTAFEASGLREKQFWKQHLEQLGITYDAFHGRLWRASRNAGDRPDLFDRGGAKSHGAPLRISGDCVVTGDWQLPTTNYDFTALPMAIGEKYLTGERTLIIAGDFINADAFSTYDSDLPTPAFEQELAAAEWLIAEMLTVFDKIYWIAGNHERRFGKRTHSALNMNHLKRLIRDDPRLIVSNWGHMVVETATGEWRITHGRNYSVNTLTVASELAQKFQQHIIGHHQHHIGMSYDRFGRYILVDNGGIFAPNQMDYAILDDSKSPAMKVGFTLLQNGVATLFGAHPFTDWQRWL